MPHSPPNAVLPAHVQAHEVPHETRPASCSHQKTHIITPYPCFHACEIMNKTITEQAL